jgi:hypothetical protein
MLKYKTFEELMASVKSDLHLYADNNLIDERNCIKAVLECNSILGLKINPIVECVLPINNFKADMPKNLKQAYSAFMVFQEVGGLLSSSYGTSTRQYTKEQLLSKGITPTEGSCRLTSCGNQFFVAANYEKTEVIFDKVVPVYLSETTLSKFTKQSPNRLFNKQREFTIDFKNEEIQTNIETGTLYISYLSELMDEEGNLLVLDHDYINPYYEWTLKAKILEDLFYNSEADVQQKLQDARNNRDQYRNRAVSLVVKPEYREISNYRKKIEQDFYDLNIKAIV